MYKLWFIVAALLAACDSSTHVSTSSVPPSGSGADGGAMPPTADAGIPGGGPVDAAGPVDGAVDGGGTTRACALSGPTKLASAHRVIEVRVDGDQVYFLDVASVFAGLYRLPKLGGTPTLLEGVLSPSDDGAAWDFAIDETAVYLISSRVDDGFGLSSNGVAIIDKASGATHFVAANAYGCPFPTFTRVTAAGGTAWLEQYNHVPGFGLSHCTQAPFDTIEELPAGATSSRTIATQEQPINRFTAGITAIVADATHLFWSGAQGTFRARHDGSAVEALAPVAAGQLVSDGQTLFAVVGTTVVAITAPQQLATIYDGTSPGDTANRAFGTVIAVDGTRVFIATPSGVVSVGKDGSAPRAIATGAPVSAVAVDETQVYYAAGSSLLTACK